jgi:hypothetical protein
MFQAMAELAVYVLWDGVLLLIGAAITATLMDIATGFLYFPNTPQDEN